MEQMREAGKDILGINNNTHIYIVISLIIIAFIIFIVMSWVFYTLKKKDSACEKLDAIYLANNKYKTSSFFRDEKAIKDDAKKLKNPNGNEERINYFDDDYECLMKNYYIKTAYNACCGDGYKNNFVNICALEKCIELGARCLDFEIYSYNGEPIVAASTANNNSIKETYNYIKLPELLDILMYRSFDLEYTACAFDPMFLHFRIMSENKVIYDKFGAYIEEKLNTINLADNSLIHSSSDNLPSDYHYSKNISDKNNIFLQPIKNFCNKFIIMVNTKHETILRNSKLNKYINVLSGSRDANSLELIRYNKIVADGTNNPLTIDRAQRKMIMVLPNIDNKLENFDPMLPRSNGCQFIGMKFQNMDNNLIGYYNLFTEQGGGYSFLLKPYNLRKDKPVPVVPPKPKDLNREQVYSIGKEAAAPIEFQQNWAKSWDLTAINSGSKVSATFGKLKAAAGGAAGGAGAGPGSGGGWR